MRKRIFSSIFFFYSSLTHFCETKQDVKQEKNSVWRHIYINYSISKKVNFPGCSGSLPTENSKLLGFKVKNCFNIFANFYFLLMLFILIKKESPWYAMGKLIFLNVSFGIIIILSHQINLFSWIFSKFDEKSPSLIWWFDLLQSSTIYYCPSMKLRQGNVS